MGLMTVNDIKSITLPIFQASHIDKVWLFGSYARGTATEESDIDFRVDRGTATGFELGRIYMDLVDALHRDVDLVTTKSLDDKFKAEIKNDEVLLYVK